MAIRWQARFQVRLHNNEEEGAGGLAVNFLISAEKCFLLEGIPDLRFLENCLWLYFHCMF